MRNLKSEKGSVATLVIVTVLFFVAILSSAYMIVATLRKGQLKNQLSVKATYEKDLDRVDEIVAELERKQNTKWPRTKETMPYLPSGFERDEDTNLDNGLVIRDSDDNEYVWIEVPRTTIVYETAGLDITEFSETELALIKADLANYAKDYRKDGYDDIWYSGCGIADSVAYTDKYNKMLKSVYQNGGFWIGKYEIGIEENTTRSFGSENSTEHKTEGQKPVIKKNKVPYNWIRCSQAESLAETFALNGYTSSLMFGLQWDLVCKHLETKGINPGTTADSLKSAIKRDSTDWGNYSNASFDITNIDALYSIDYGENWKKVSDETNKIYTRPLGSILLTTGADARNSMLNIYDLAGNVWEWTLEKTSIDAFPCTFRGGDYNDLGSYNPVSNRNVDSTTDSNPYYGARVSIY